MGQFYYLFSCFFFLPLIATQYRSLKEKAGPYDIEVHYMENCQKPGPDSIQFATKMKKYNRTAIVVDVNITLGTPLDDNIKGILTLAQFTNGGWKENFYKKEFEKSCTSLKYYASEILEHALATAKYPKKSCPIAKGNYSMKNFVLALDIPAIPVFFYNKYKYELKGLYKGKQVACMRAEADVVPKKHNTKG